MRTNFKRALLGQKGIALLEVVLAAIILGIAAAGVALMLSHAKSSVVSQGDRYVALYLTQQKIESLIRPATLDPVAGFDGLPIGNSTPEVLQAGEAFASGAAPVQSFTRNTCITYVPDTNPGDPTVTCPCAGCAATNTKRITVTVTLSSPTGTTKAFLGADPVTLVTVATRHPA